MRLPLKFLPRISQLVADVIGGVILLGFGLVFFSQYASPSDLERYHGFGEWLHANPLDLPFLLSSVALLLLGLGWLAVTVMNLVSGSPFNYLIVDRAGITYRNFWRENHYPWKSLGPVQSLKLSSWQGRSSQRRHWIAADASGAETVGVGPFWANPTDTLRIPASVYLGGGFLIGTLDLATDDAAGWLEELRQLARNGHLEAEDIPPPPANFRTPIAIGSGADIAPAPMPRDGKAKSGGAPTVER
jgi:hypothetical protein